MRIRTHPRSVHTGSERARRKKFTTETQRGEVATTKEAAITVGRRKPEGRLNPNVDCLHPTLSEVRGVDVEQLAINAASKSSRNCVKLNVSIAEDTEGKEGTEEEIHHKDAEGTEFRISGFCVHVVRVLHVAIRVTH